MSRACECVVWIVDGECNNTGANCLEGGPPHRFFRAFPALWILVCGLGVWRRELSLSSYFRDMEVYITVRTPSCQ